MASQQLKFCDTCDLSSSSGLKIGELYNNAFRSCFNKLLKICWIFIFAITYFSMIEINVRQIVDRSHSIRTISGKVALKLSWVNSKIVTKIQWGYGNILTSADSITCSASADLILKTLSNSKIPLEFAFIKYVEFFTKLYLTVFFTKQSVEVDLW